MTIIKLVSDGLTKRSGLSPEICPAPAPHSSSHPPTYLYFLPDQSCLMIQSMKTRYTNMFYLISISTLSFYVCLCVCLFVFAHLLEKRQLQWNNHKFNISFIYLEINTIQDNKQFYTPSKVVFHMLQNDDEKKQQWIWPQWYGITVISFP